MCRYGNGDRYEGGWKHGRWDGEGKLQRANGDRYEGSFAQGYRHGEGVFT